MKKRLNRYRVTNNFDMLVDAKDREEALDKAYEIMQEIEHKYGIFNSEQVNIEEDEFWEDL